MIDKIPSIAELSQMDDAGLMSTFGLDLKLQALKEDIAKLNTLQGADRKKADDKVERMLTPNVYLDDLRYTYEDIMRAKNKTKGSGDAMLESCPAPADVL